IIENAVRQRVTQHSSVMFTRRLQRISRVTGSKSVPNAHPQVAKLIDAQAISTTEDGSRLPLLDDRRARDLRTGPERVAVVDGRGDEATPLRKVGGSRAAGHAPGRRCEAGQPYLRVGTERAQPPVQDQRLIAREDVVIQAAVLAVEVLAQLVGTGADRHHDVVE